MENLRKKLEDIETPLSDLRERLEEIRPFSFTERGVWASMHKNPMLSIRNPVLLRASIKEMAEKFNKAIESAAEDAMFDLFYTTHLTPDPISRVKGKTSTPISWDELVEQTKGVPVEEKRDRSGLGMDQGYKRFDLVEEESVEPTATPSEAVESRDSISDSISEATEGVALAAQELADFVWLNPYAYSGKVDREKILKAARIRLASLLEDSRDTFDALNAAVARLTREKNALRFAIECQKGLNERLTDELARANRETESLIESVRGVLDEFDGGEDEG